MILKKIFKKNQIIITALALMIAVAGYINYSDNIKNKNKSASGKENATLIENETDAASGDILSNDAEPDALEDPGSMVFTSSVTSQFIISAKLEREQVRASGKETLLEVINNAELSEEAKAQAVADMVALADASEKEAAAELLLEAKGFENVIVSMTGGQVDVVVEISELTDTDLAQIEDIVTRKTGCSLENLTITSVSPVKDDAEETSGKTDTENETGESTDGGAEDTQTGGENETAEEGESESESDAGAVDGGVEG